MLNESVHRSRVVVEATDGKLQQEYDSKLREALQHMREENDEQIRIMREETELVFEKKVGLMCMICYKHVDVLLPLTCLKRS